MMAIAGVIMEPVKVNLGCGRDYKEGWLNWDISKTAKPDAIVDVRTDAFPLGDEQADEIYCSGVLEQILQNEDLVHCLNECHRILKHKGVMRIHVPDSRFSTTFRDPFDVRHFTKSTFYYLDGSYKEYNDYGAIYGFKPWRVLTCITDDARGIITVELQKIW